MLGDFVGEEHGRVVVRRVLPGAPPSVEVSFEASGTMLGVASTDMGTYVSQIRPDGSLYGEGQGVILTADGGMASWTGQGAGRLTGKGAAVSYRGSVFYQSNHPSLSRLNGVACVFEYDVDENGATSSKLWEWT